MTFNPINSDFTHDEIRIDHEAESSFAAKTVEEQFQSIKREIELVKSGFAKSMAIERKKIMYLDAIDNLIDFRHPKNRTN